MKRKISAIIACYKDAQAIPLMYKRLESVFKKINVNYEIIFVNDGSPDNTEEILEKLAKKDPNVIGINHTRNFNSQMAFTSGMEIASGDAIVFLDGDLQDPPEIIEKFYKKWIQGYDVVYGIRVKRIAPIPMVFFYKLFYRLFSKLSYVQIPVDAGDFSLIDKKVYTILKTFPERDRFLRGLRAWVGFKQIGINYIRPERVFGKSTTNYLNNFDWAIRGILSFSHTPTRVMTLLSLFIFFMAGTAMVIQIALFFFKMNVSSSTSILLTTIILLGSIQLLFLSILGEYAIKIFDEVKQRPKFVVKSVFKQGRKV